MTELKMIEEDIELATRFDCEHCAVALTLRRYTIGSPRVGHSHIILFDRRPNFETDILFSTETPKEVGSFMYVFDTMKRGNIHPINFKLDIPPHLLREKPLTTNVVSKPN